MVAQGAQAEPGLKVAPQRPYLKPWYRLARLDGKLIFEYGDSSVALEGKAVEKLLPALLPLLDGTRTTAEIEGAFGEKVKPAIANALSTLGHRGLLTDGPPIPPDTAADVAATAHLLSSLSGDELTVNGARAGLAAAPVAVVGAGAAAVGIADALGEAGLENLQRLDWEAGVESLEPLRLAIAAPDFSELPRLRAWNRLALEAKLAWLQVIPFDGRIAAVGPLYVPDETCCYECYLLRRAANSSMQNQHFLALADSPAAYPSTPPLQLVIAGLGATVALRWLGERLAGQEAGHVPGTLHAIEWDETVNLSRHFVYRVPRCPACFEDQGTPAPWHA